MSTEVTTAPSRFYRLGWVFYLLMALAGVAWIGWRDGRVGAAVFFDAQRWWLDLAIGLGVALAMWLAWRLATPRIELAQRLESRFASLLGELDREQAIGLAMLSGFSEEFFFRGAVQGSFGLAAATLLFAVLHTGREPEMRLWTLFALVAGLLFGVLTLWRGNLLAAITAHGVFNGISLWRYSAGAGRPAAAETGSVQRPPVKTIPDEERDDE